MNEAGKAAVVVLQTGQHSFVFVQRCKQPFDFSLPLVPLQYAAILGGWTGATFSARADQLNPIGGEFFIDRITVIDTIPDSSLGQSHDDRFIEGSSDLGGFMWTSRSRLYIERKACSFHKCHELRTLSGLGSHFALPFFATTRGPSMKYWNRSISPRPCRSSFKASSTWRSVPSLPHWLKRRKQAAYDVYRSGKPAQTVPVLRTYNTSSRTDRLSCSVGLPLPFARCLRCGIKGQSTVHCSSVRNCRLAISDSDLSEIGADWYL